MTDIILKGLPLAQRAAVIELLIGLPPLTRCCLFEGNVVVVSSDRPPIVVTPAGDIGQVRPLPPSPYG